MHHLLCLLLLSFSLIANENSNMVSHYGVEDAIVDDMVNAITGELCFQRVDHKIGGICELPLEIFYCSSFNMGLAEGIECCGSSHNYATRLDNRPYNNGDRYESHFLQGCGSQIICSGKNSRHGMDKLLRFNLSHPSSKGFTNASSGFPQGKFNPKNITIYCPKEINKNCTVTMPNGETRVYKHKDAIAEFISVPGGSQLKYTGDTYAPHIIRKPNGHKLHFTHDNHKVTVKATNDAEDVEFGSCVIKGDGDNQKQVLFDDGSKISYQLTPYKTSYDAKRKYINDVTSPHNPHIHYKYVEMKQKGDAKVEVIEYPENRTTKFNYFVEGVNDWLTYKKGDPQVGRVHYIQKPLGPSGQYVNTARLVYDVYLDKDKNITGGRTEFRDANGRRSYYFYDNQQRLTCVEKQENDCAYSFNEWTWGTSGSNLGHVLSQRFLDAKKNKQTERTYQYDGKGNTTCLTLSGNLTGDGWSDQKTFYTYSNDDFNLMLSESDGKKTIRMDYIPNTNLLKKKWIEINGKTIQREFNSYDKNAALTETIIDDGSGNEADDLTNVSERRITRIKPKNIKPCIGLPQEIEEFYLQDGQEKRLKRIVNEYSPQGWLIKQEVFNADNEWIYTLFCEYNSYGQPTYWNDPLGHEYKRTYDLNGNCLEEWGPRTDCHISYEYDLLNRKTSKTLHTAEGQKLKEMYVYDNSGDLIKSIDHTGAVTEYTYKGQRQISKTTNALGNASYQYYDVLGHLTEVIDENNHKTKMKHTVYGQPYWIEYPDGSTEEMRYSTDGLLIYKKNKNGSVSRKTYDALNREILDELYSHEGELITSSSKTYNTFHLLSETNGEGLTTLYFYDGAGRKIREEKGTLLTEFSYDALGRVNEERREGQIKRFSYDLLDHLTEETLEDETSTLLYKKIQIYGPTGKVIEETTLGTTFMEYDSQDRLIKKTDPLGHIEYVVYDDFKRITCHIDALGLQTITSKNALQQVTEIEKRASNGHTLSITRNIYDAVGNTLSTSYTLYEEGQPNRTVINAWEYDPLKRPILEIKGLGTEEETRTHTTYNPAGQKERITKPDGVTLFYTYTPHGHLKTLHSSDGSVSYQITYNRIGQVTEAKDLLTGLKTTRLYNPQGLLFFEDLGHGLSLSFHYDSLERVQEVELPDSSRIFYNYQGANLSSVSRNHQTISFPRYDLAGNLLEIVYPIGSTTYMRDLHGRPIEICTPAWKSTLSYDAVGNITKKTFQNEETLYTYDPLYQITQEQGPHPHTYGYDTLYNRTKKDQEETFYNALNQPTHLSYDPNGNLLHLNSHHFRYDALDRLIAVDNTTYTYDFFNRRLFKNKERYLYQGQNEIGSPDSHQFRLLAKGIEAEIGAAILFEINGKTYFPLHDEQGSVTTLLNTQKQIIEQIHYTSFGEETSSHKFLTPWRFSSKRFDPESSFIYFGRRYYSPYLGRWTTADPAGYSDGPNLYAYVHNNPLTHYDAYGLMSACSPYPDPIYLRKRAEILKKEEEFLKNPYVTHDENFKNSSLCRGNHCIERTPGITSKHIGLGLTNGVNNTLGEARKNAMHLSRLTEDHAIDLVYNPTNGLFRDSMRYIKSSSHYLATPVVDNLHKAWDNFFDKSDPRALYIQYAHSEGVNNVQKALMSYDKNLRKRIISINIAPSVYIDEDLCHSRVHYVSSRDFVPFLDKAGFYRNRDSIRFLDAARGADWWDHGFRSPTYRRPLTWEFRAYKEINNKRLSE